MDVMKTADETLEAARNTTLDLMCDMVPIYKVLNKKGLLSLVFCDEPGYGVHLRRRDFLDLFPEHTIEPYRSTHGEPARKAVGVYRGQRFFTLLDDEPLNDEGLEDDE